ncbi:MAG: hypothetical protein HOE76_05060 [Euryarchaeota archaeon]|nr:hypothetical protein [Euryarchaeota archaeon]MBT4982178.1 hypothetical protein [Euryarchaeota archaeon]MBT5184497.1 hypothetical protein [Euryarchaeota archaeon]
MAGMESEIARLSNKDVRVRRRAVRNLFDDDNPRALKGFIPLLDDSDAWFRNKSLDAHRKWANNADDLLPLLKNHKRVAGELLERIEAPDISHQLLEDDDHITRSFAAKSLANIDSLHGTFALDAHHSIRIVAAENSTDTELISSLITDVHSLVRKSAISTASREGLELSQTTLDKGLGSSDPALRSLVASLTVKIGGDMLEKACRDSNPKVRKSIADTLRSEVLEVDSRINSISEYCPEIIVRWLRLRHDKKASSLRWSMIENRTLNSRSRSKLIEQMDGRTDVDLVRLSDVAKDDSPLVRIAAMNLSASVSELSGEET